ncbi:MAG: DoxX family protein [Candidatus Magasanikbacteria bacterium]|nr:DoxX family protein [Candidatus Magasanikbacteria bacterium]
MFPTLLTFSAFGLLVLRVFVGLVFLPHGYAKLKNPKAMAQGMGWSAAAISVLGFVETASGLLMILGLLTQWAALLLALVMVGAWYHKIFKWHKKFMGDGGWELDFVLFAANVAILLSGAGAWALDSRVF